MRRRPATALAQLRASHRLSHLPDGWAILCSVRTCHPFRTTSFPGLLDSDISIQMLPNIQVLVAEHHQANARPLRPVLVCCAFCVSLICLSPVPSLPQHRPLGSHALTRHKVQLLPGTRDSAAARLVHLAVSSCRMSDLVSWQDRSRLTVGSLRVQS